MNPMLKEIEFKISCYLYRNNLTDSKGIAKVVAHNLVMYDCGKFETLSDFFLEMESKGFIYDKAMAYIKDYENKFSCDKSTNASASYSDLLQAMD